MTIYCWGHRGQFWRIFGFRARFWGLCEPFLVLLGYLESIWGQGNGAILGLTSSLFSAQSKLNASKFGTMGQTLKIQ